MIKWLFVLLCVFLVGCEDCSKPNKQVCIKSRCNTIFVTTRVGSMPVLTPINQCHCLEYETIKNECYKEVK